MVLAYLRDLDGGVVQRGHDENGPMLIDALYFDHNDCRVGVRTRAQPVTGFDFDLVPTCEV